MRGWLCVVVASLALLGGSAPAAGVPSQARSPATILIETSTGQVLSEHDADSPRPAASLYQLMLALLTLEEAGLGGLPLDAAVSVSEFAVRSGAGGVFNTIVPQTAPPHAVTARGGDTVSHAAGEDGSHVSLRPDKVYRLSDLLKAMLVTS